MCAKYWMEGKKNGCVPGWKEAYIIYIYIYMIHYHDDGNEKKKQKALLCYIGLVYREKWVIVWMAFELVN